MADQGVRRRKNASKATSAGENGSSLHEKRQQRLNGDGHSHDNGKSSSNTTTTTTTTNLQSKKEYDEYAWFVVFLTALSYFIFTRGGNSHRGGLLSSFSKPYDVVASSVAVAHEGKENNEELLRSIFYIDKKSQKESSPSQLLTLSPYYRLEVILSSPPDVLIENSNDHAEECSSSSNEQHNNHNQHSIPYLSHLSSTTWVHDEELGRGYLLIADAGRAGRIWRWEVGGGPITIGRSLHMERSGCRSHLWVDIEGRADGNDNNRTTSTCPENLFGDSASENNGQVSCTKTWQQSSKPPMLGSASLAVELTRNAERASAGANIIVSEWGERRIIRLEGETGARTPLVTLVPSHNEAGEDQRRRVYRPNHLTYTPFGDLLFSDTIEVKRSNNSSYNGGDLGVIYRRKEAVHISPVAADQSRDAHGWRSSTGKDDEVDGNIDVLFQTNGSIEGMALGADFSTLYVLVATQQTTTAWTKTLYKLLIGSDDDEDEDGEESNGDNAAESTDEVTAIYNMTSADCKESNIDSDLHSSNGSKLTLDEKGILYLITCPSTVTLLSSDDGHLVGSLALDSEQNLQATSFTSIGFGEDGYMYITSSNELMRVKSRVGGMSLPTDMVVPPPLKKPK